MSKYERTSEDDLPLESFTNLGPDYQDSEDFDLMVFSSQADSSNDRQIPISNQSTKTDSSQSASDFNFDHDLKTKYQHIEIEDETTTFSPFIENEEIEEAPLVLSDEEDPGNNIPNESNTNPNSSLSSFTWQNFISFAGPGWLTSIAYMDPGNLEAGIQAAALCGNRLLWALLWSHALALFVQNLSSRIGSVTGKHLSEHVSNRYPPYLNVLLYFMVEVAIIGSDIQMVISTSIALNVLFRLPHWVGTLISLVDILTFFLLRKIGTRKLETVYIGLILVMAACFIAETVLSKPEILPILEGVAIPYVPTGAVVQAIGMFGSVIMPHNFYLNSGLVSQRKIERSDPKKKQVSVANKFFLLESGIALLGSFFINSCVVIVFSQVFFYSSGGVSRDDIGLGDASQALQNVLGNAGPYLWGVGLLAAAQSTTVTGTLAGRFVLEGFWNINIEPWQRLMATRVIAVIPSFFVAIFANSQLDMVGEYLNAIQSIQLPFVLIPILKIGADKQIMGKFANPLYLQVIYWVVGVVVIAMNAYSLVHFAQTLPLSPLMYILFCLIALTYIIFICLLCFCKPKKPKISTFNLQ